MQMNIFGFGTDKDIKKKVKELKNSSNGYIECFGSGGMRMDVKKAIRDGKLRDAIKPKQSEAEVA